MTIYDSLYNLQNYCIVLLSRYNAERYVAKPMKLAASGQETGLKILFYTNFEDYLVSEYSAYGAKVSEVQ